MTQVDNLTEIAKRLGFQPIEYLEGIVHTLTWGHLVLLKDGFFSFFGDQRQ